MILYRVHVCVFTVSSFVFLGSLSFTSCAHFFKKYYAFNEFYKLQVINYFNISICVAILLILIAQLLLPVNFVWSLFRKGNNK